MGCSSQKVVQTDEANEKKEEANEDKNEEFQISLKECKAKVIEITEINSVKCGQYSFMYKNFTFKLMANFFKNIKIQK